MALKLGDGSLGMALGFGDDSGILGMALELELLSRREIVRVVMPLIFHRTAVETRKKGLPGVYCTRPTWKNWPSCATRTVLGTQRVFV